MYIQFSGSSSQICTWFITDTSLIYISIDCIFYEFVCTYYYGIAMHYNSDYYCSIIINVLNCHINCDMRGVNHVYVFIIPAMVLPFSVN